MIPNESPLLQKIQSMLLEQAANAAKKAPLDEYWYQPSRQPENRMLWRDAEHFLKSQNIYGASHRLFRWRNQHSTMNRWLLLSGEVKKLCGMHINEASNFGKSIGTEIRDLSEGCHEEFAPLFWGAVREALEAEPGHKWPPEWRILHGEACVLTKDVAAARRDVAILCWHHPEDAENAFATSRFQCRQLVALWNEFGDTELETQDFPSWFLLQARGDAVEPDMAPNSPNGEAYRILYRILNLQCFNPDDRFMQVKSLREELQAARPKFYEAYLRSVELRELSHAITRV